MRQGPMGTSSWRHFEDRRETMNLKTSANHFSGGIAECSKFPNVWENLKTCSAILRKFSAYFSLKLVVEARCRSWDSMDSLQSFKENASGACKFPKRQPTWLTRSKSFKQVTLSISILLISSSLSPGSFVFIRKIEDASVFQSFKSLRVP